MYSSVSNFFYLTQCFRDYSMLISICTYVYIYTFIHTHIHAYIFHPFLFKSFKINCSKVKVPESWPKNSFHVFEVLLSGREKPFFIFSKDSRKIRNSYSNRVYIEFKTMFPDFSQIISPNTQVNFLSQRTLRKIQVAGSLPVLSKWLEHYCFQVRICSLISYFSTHSTVIQQYNYFLDVGEGSEQSIQSFLFLVNFFSNIMGENYQTGYQILQLALID